MKYDKLVRNNIPEIIEKTGKKCIVKAAAGDEINTYLHKKFIEEVEELCNATTKEDQIEEMADILSVLREFCRINKLLFADAVYKQLAKDTEKGDFSKHIILIEVIDYE